MKECSLLTFMPTEALREEAVVKWWCGGDEF